VLPSNSRELISFQHASLALRSFHFIAHNRFRSPTALSCEQLIYCKDRPETHCGADPNRHNRSARTLRHVRLVGCATLWICHEHGGSAVVTLHEFPTVTVRGRDGSESSELCQCFLL